jgi:hypothetical protein
MSLRDIQASHAMGTSATFSAISSLSTSTASSRRNRSLRRHSNIDSNSDEEQHDLNEVDSAWYELPAPAPELFDDEALQQGFDDDAQEESKSRTGSFIGDMLDNLVWNFKEIPANSDGLNDDSCPPPYESPKGLKRYVKDLIQTPFDALELVAFDYEYVATLAANSNEYYRNVIMKNKADRNNRFCGAKWHNIETSEMYHFLGIMLKISLLPVDGEGYNAYFRKRNKVVCGKIISGTKGFATEFMDITRFKQIRSAFHPENSEYAKGGDKCYQLRSTLRQLNTCAAKVFNVGPDLTFDEGGIACRSRFCPVRQYNKDKPQKFRVDMFICADARHYGIYHVDVYQEKNSSNIDIDKSITSVPTTQKAVLNACIKMRLHQKKNHGARHLTMDNRYQCPELAYTLRSKFKILSTGTCRQNRKGWNKEYFDLKKTDGRGEFKAAYDETNKVVAIQWNDSKVVNFITTVTADWGITHINRQVGSQKLRVKCPKPITRYHETMFGVDKGDQYRARAGGFANKAHFKK